jgi:type II secretory pathway pseudopilin PulG
MTKQTSLIVSIVIIIALLALVFFSYNRHPTKQTPNTPTATTTTNSGTSTEKYITAKHQYTPATNEHIVAGTLESPTICDVLDTSASVNKNTDPVTVTIHFKLTNTSDTCAQAVGEQRFKVSFKAPKNAKIEATLNALPVHLSLVPVPEGEDLSNFQIYVKG